MFDWDHAHIPQYVYVRLKCASERNHLEVAGSILTTITTNREYLLLFNAYNPSWFTELEQSFLWIK